MLDRCRRRCTSWAVALAAASQAVEACLLESMYIALALALALTPGQLGALSAARGLTQSFVSPVTGLLGDAWHRGRIIAAGTLAWSASSLAFGLCVNYAQALAFAALSGAGLALVMPCVTAIISDLYEEKQRGIAFGWVLFAAAAATVLALSFDINLSPVRTASISGWRLCYFVAAALGLASACVSAACIWEPRGGRAGRGAPAAEPWTRRRCAEACRGCAVNVLAVARTPTFLIILVENISNLTRATGFSPASTAAVAVASTVGSALGFLAGGAVGDATSRRWPNAARPAANQLSLALSIPLVVLVLKGMPESSAHASGWPGSSDGWAWAYGLLLFLISLLGSWCYTNNMAMYALVIRSPMRTTAYSLDTCVAGLLSVASTPLVGILAQRAGYQQLYLGDLSTAAEWAAAAAASVRNAAALENALLQVILAATSIKLVAYTGLYWTLPRDRLEGAGAPTGAAPDLATSSMAPFLGGGGGGGGAVQARGEGCAALEGGGGERMPAPASASA